MSSSDLGMGWLDFDFRVRGPYGDPELIQAIADAQAVPPAWVLPVPGTSTANVVALASVTQPGGKVMLERPVYDPLVGVTRLLGLEAEYFDRRPDAGFRWDPGVIKAGLARGVAAICLTNLHNPSGQLVHPDDMAELIRLTGDRGVHLIVDEVYLDYARINGGLETLRVTGTAEHVISTNSLTKVYGLGPIRAGWLLGHPRVLERAKQVVDLLHVNHPVVSGRVAVHAIEVLDALAARTRRIHDAAYPVFASWLESRRDVRGYAHVGALFAWLRLPEGCSAEVWTARLSDRFETNVVSGHFFGDDGHVRVGFGVAPDVLAEGLARMGEALDVL
ncbi:MAG: pyridoxal phosphate-dependent aminotransferase [Phycisphaerae bacterium]